ncbi:hypothetical protein AVEN_98271-1, partial [Araneus ventricosus]
FDWETITVVCNIHVLTVGHWDGLTEHPRPNGTLIDDYFGSENPHLIVGTLGDDYCDLEYPHLIVGTLGDDYCDLKHPHPAGDIGRRLL